MSPSPSESPELEPLERDEYDEPLDRELELLEDRDEPLEREPPLNELPPPGLAAARAPSMRDQVKAPRSATTHSHRLMSTARRAAR
jgi:hypothetical protein